MVSQQADRQRARQAETGLSMSRAKAQGLLKSTRQRGKAKAYVLGIEWECAEALLMRCDATARGGKKRCISPCSGIVPGRNCKEDKRTALSCATAQHLAGRRATRNGEGRHDIRVLQHGEAEKHLGRKLTRICLQGVYSAFEARPCTRLLTSTMSADLHLAQCVPLMLPGTAKTACLPHGHLDLMP